MAIRRDMAGRLDGKRRTPQGGLRADANLTRVGIFTYYNTDGTKVRELRPPEEVFNEDSLESLKLAPLTVGHPGVVKSDNYQKLAVGVVAENVRRRGDAPFVAADVLIQDADTIKKIDNGELVELSCGYEVDLDHTPGEWEGERYDAVQRNIRYNHVGLGPANWGRAGNEVRLKLDSAGNVALEAESYSRPMLTQEEIDALTAERDAYKSELDTVKASLAESVSELTRVKTDSLNMLTLESAYRLVDSRVALESSARSILGADWKPVVLKREDSGNEVPVRLTDREVMTAAITKADPKLTLDGKSDDYVRAAFDLIVDRSIKADAAVAALAVAGATPIADANQTEPGPLAKAEAKRLEEAKIAAAGGAPPGSLTKSAR